MVIDVDQDLFLSGAAAWHEPQADGVGLTSCHLQERGDFSFAWASTLLQKLLELYYDKQAHGWNTLYLRHIQTGLTVTWTDRGCEDQTGIKQLLFGADLGWCGQPGGTPFPCTALIMSKGMRGSLNPLTDCPQHTSHHSHHLFLPPQFNYISSEEIHLPVLTREVRDPRLWC